MPITTFFLCINFCLLIFWEYNCWNEGRWNEGRWEIMEHLCEPPLNINVRTKAVECGSINIPAIFVHTARESFYAI